MVPGGRRSSCWGWARPEPPVWHLHQGAVPDRCSAGPASDLYPCGLGLRAPPRGGHLLRAGPSSYSPARHLERALGQGHCACSDWCCGWCPQCLGRPSCLCLPVPVSPLSLLPFSSLGSSCFPFIVSLFPFSVTRTLASPSASQSLSCLLAITGSFPVLPPPFRVSFLSTALATSLSLPPSLLSLFLGVCFRLFLLLCSFMITSCLSRPLSHSLSLLSLISSVSLTLSPVPS